MERSFLELPPGLALDLALDMSALRERVDAVLGRAPYWFPVRHHSPTVALHLGAVIRQRRPALVLIEGPAHATPLVPHLLDRRTRPPVAIYSSYRDDDDVLGRAGKDTPSPDVPFRSATWYPLVPYSPELVAIQAAREVGAECAFIDAPHHALIGRYEGGSGESLGSGDGADGGSGEGSGEGSEGSGEGIEGSGEGSEAADPSAGVESDEHGSEWLMVHSEFYRQLARAAGFRTFDEAWDGLFEVAGRTRSAEDFRRDMAYFCAATRATVDPRRIASDDTLPRERYMYAEVKRHLAERSLDPEAVVVVTGGFHLMLDRDDPTAPPQPPAGTVNTTLVPYSYYRMAERSGYAAGNRAPAFYQQQWNIGGGDYHELVLEHVTRVIRRARRKGRPLSSADAIAVTQHATMLGQLRGRSEPVLDDIEDALVTCCCKGDPDEVGLELREAMVECAVGSRVGAVTPAVGQLPIAADFHAQLSELKLGEATQRDHEMELKLDLREPGDARRSAFLHRLGYLGVPLANNDRSAGDLRGTINQERWTLRWSPRIDPALAECSQYGDTLEGAATARLEEELARAGDSAGATAGRVLEAIQMDLPGVTARLGAICGPAIDADARFVSLAQGLGRLLMLDQHAAYRELDRAVVADLVVRCYGRATFAIPDVSSVPPEEEAAVVQGLMGVAEALLGQDRIPLDRDLFSEYVRIAAADTTVMYMRGVFLGLLAELRVLAPDDLAAEIRALARGSMETMVEAGSFVRGAMEVSRTSLMLGADTLVRAVDELLRAADWDTFLVMLPRLRAAFGRLQGADLGVFCGRVAHAYALGDAEELDLSLTVGAAALMAEVDHRVAEIMEEWDA